MDTGLKSPSLVFPMRPAALGSRGRASLEDEGPFTVKLEDSEGEGEAVAWDPGPEAARQRFRRFRYEEVAGPSEALARLRELCRQWLRPEAHSKEQMLELLVLEQFLGALPPEIQARVRGQQPGSPEEAAALVEGLRREPGGPRRWVSQRLGVSASSWAHPAQQDASPPRSASGHLQQTLWQGGRGSDASPLSAGVRTQAAGLGGWGGGQCRQKRAIAGHPCPPCQSLGAVGPQRPSQYPWDPERVEAGELPT